MSIPYSDPLSVDFGIGINNANADYKAIHGFDIPYDPGMISVHSQRCAYDYYTGGLSWTASKIKHLNEYRDEYQLPHVGPTPIPPGPVPTLPAPPSRDQLLSGRFKFQGLTVTLPRFGTMPWWGACWMWLTEDERKSAAAQLIAQGQTLLDIEVPSGKPLYDEPGQFYSADKFPAIDPSWTEIGNAIAYAVSYGFTGVWLFLGGDDGQQGYPIALSQVGSAASVFASHPSGDVRKFVVPIPGYDGVWHKPNPTSGTGYNPPQIRQFSLTARASGFATIGIEGGVGYLLCGEGGANYAPGGNMSGYDLILSEYNDGVFEAGDFWQIMARYLGPAYVRPAAQQQHVNNGPSDPLYPEANDPHPEFVLKSLNEQGLPYVHRPFEYGLYGFVRSTPPSAVASWRQQFVAAGSPDVLVC
jgi:hypothetical protein